MEIIGVSFVNAVEIAGSTRIVWVKQHNPEATVELVKQGGFLKITDNRPYSRLVPLSNVKDILYKE